MARWTFAVALLALGLSAATLLRDTRDGELESRIERLEEQLGELREERGPARVSSGAVSPDTTDAVYPIDPSLDKRLRNLESVLAREIATGGPEDFRPPGAPVEELELERTRSALQALQQEQIQGQLERWVAREQEEAEKVVDHLVETFPLTGRQEQQLRQIFLSEQETQSALITSLWSDEAPPDREGLAAAWDEAVEAMKDARAARDTALEELYGAEQWGKVQKAIQAAKKPAKPRNPQSP